MGGGGIPDVPYPRITDHSSLSHILLLFMLLRTLLHSRKTQLFCFQWIPHSLRKTTRGVGRGSHFCPESARRNHESPAAAGQAGALLTPALGLHDDFRPAGEDRGG